MGRTGFSSRCTAIVKCSFLCSVTSTTPRLLSVLFSQKLSAGAGRGLVFYYTCSDVSAADAAASQCVRGSILS